MGKRVEKHLRSDPQLLVVHSLCMMHMFWAGIHNALQSLNLVSPVFCCSILAHKARYMRTVRRHLKSQLLSLLKPCFTPPDAAGKEPQESEFMGIGGIGISV